MDIRHLSLHTFIAFNRVHDPHNRLSLVFYHQQSDGKCIINQDLWENKKKRNKKIRLGLLRHSQKCSVQENGNKTIKDNKKQAGEIVMVKQRARNRLDKQESAEPPNGMNTETPSIGEY